MSNFELYRGHVAARNPTPDNIRVGLGIPVDANASANTPAAVAALLHSELWSPAKTRGRTNEFHRAAATLLNKPLVQRFPYDPVAGAHHSVVDIWRDPRDPDAGMMAVTQFSADKPVVIVPLRPGTKVPTSQVVIDLAALGFSRPRGGASRPVTVGFMSSSRLVITGARVLTNGSVDQYATLVYDFVNGVELMETVGAGAVVIVGMGDDAHVLTSRASFVTNGHNEQLNIISPDLSVTSFGSHGIPGQGVLRCRTLDDVFLIVTNVIESRAPNNDVLHQWQFRRLLGGVGTGSPYRTTNMVLRTPASRFNERRDAFEFLPNRVSDGAYNHTDNPGSGLAATWRRSSGRFEPVISVQRYAQHPHVAVSASTVGWVTSPSWAQFPTGGHGPAPWTGDLMAARVVESTIEFINDIGDLAIPHDLMSAKTWAW